MVNYVRLAATVKRLIGASGRTVTLVKQSTTPANVLEPWKGPADEDATIAADASSVGTGKAGFPVFATFVKSDDELGELFASLAGTNVRRGAKIALVAGSDVTPEQLEEYDTMIDGDDVWSIESVDTLRPGPIVVLHALVLGR